MALTRLSAALVRLFRGTLKDAITYVTPEMFGAKGDGIADDSDAIQAAHDYVVSQSKTAGHIVAPQSVLFGSVYKVTKTIRMDGARVRFSTTSGGGIYFDPNGTYTNKVCIHVGGYGTDSAYAGQVGGIFEGLLFNSSGRKLDLIYAANETGKDSSENGSCLHNVNSISAKGFNRIFTHGAGGWGWTWVGCQFCDSNRLMLLWDAHDTYERHSFFSCTWQGGGYAFEIDNADGRVYWHAGSIDYCEGLAIIKAGHLEANGHNEWRSRNIPLVKITGSNASAVISGTLFITKNTETPYYIFEQATPRQVTLRDVVIVTDGQNVGSGILSNKEFNKENLITTGDAAKRIIYNSCDENLIKGNMTYADCFVTNEVTHGFKVENDQIVLTATGGGANVYFNLDICVQGMSKIAVKLTGNNTSSNPIFLSKYLLTRDKQRLEDLTSIGTASWAGNKQSVGGTATVIDIPKHAGYLRLSFNLFNLNAATNFTISDLKVITY